MSMNEERPSLCERRELYVLGGLSTEEMTEFEQHLLLCADCERVVRELRDIVDLIPLGTEQVSPKAGMKNRILGRILQDTHAVADERPAPELTEQEINDETTTGQLIDDDQPINHSFMVPQPIFPSRNNKINGRRNVLQKLAISVLSAAVVVLCLYSFQLTRNMNELKSDIAMTTGPTKQPIMIDEVVTLSAAAKDIVAEGLATIVIDARGTHLLVQADKLPELEGTQAYQVWLIKGKETHNAGTFLSRNGKGALYLTFEPQGYDTIAITLEPDATSTESPKGSIVLAAPLTKKL